MICRRPDSRIEEREVSASIRGCTQYRLRTRGLLRSLEGRRFREQLKVLEAGLMLIFRRSSRRVGLRTPCLLMIRGERREGRRGNSCW